MCLSVPARVTAVHDRHWATVETGGASRRISIDLVEDVQVGDYVLLHVGFALQKIDEAEALATLEAFEQLLEAEEREGISLWGGEPLPPTG
ncbi:MAG TPA: HypC/HybG/HupF family hydrogenase formation chaperone [Chloroflexota bacterium]|nr:HypC/HybG/HupF family hydrogenase formation chaperone [Chloroflexota bacterium]